MQAQLSKNDIDAVIHTMGMGQAVRNTVYTEGSNKPSKVVNEDGSIIPKKNREADFILLTPLGVALAQRYAQKDPILARVLDPAMMTEIRSKIVENKEDKAEKKKEKEVVEKDRLGLKKLKKGGQCRSCDATNSCFTFNFGIEGGEFYNFCHRADCKKARDRFGAKLLSQSIVASAKASAAPSSSRFAAAAPSAAKKVAKAAAPVASSNNNAKTTLANLSDAKIEDLLINNAGKDKVIKMLNAEKARRLSEMDLLAMSEQGNEEESEAADNELSRRIETGLIEMEA